jgi:1-acyl-sn-glycerol-3-phosphate acyltransferase
MLLLKMSERLHAPHPRIHQASAKAVRLITRLKHDLHVTGQENLEKATESGRSFIIAPNHRSFWDIPMVTSAVDRTLPSAQVHYMASAHLLRGSNHAYKHTALQHLESYWWPAVPRYMAACGTFWIDRTEKTIASGTLEHLEYVVDNNGVLAIFPEGTRNRDQIDKTIVEKKRIKIGASAIAAHFGIDIVPTGIAGTVESDRKRAHVHFGEVIPVEQQQVDFASAKSMVVTTRDVAPQLFEGMNKALAVAYAERDVYQ